MSHSRCLIIFDKPFLTTSQARAQRRSVTGTRDLRVSYCNSRYNNLLNIEFTTAMEHSPISVLTHTPSTDAFAFSETEQTILSLWDQLQELQLERALVQVQPAVTIPAPTTPSLGPELAAAEQALLETRTTHTLQQNTTINVLIADPILKAVHDAAAATTLERRLAPLIHERDVLGLTDSHLSSKLAGLQQRFTALEAEMVKLNEENRALAATLVEIADQMKDQTVDELDDTRLTTRLEGLDDEIRNARRRWRVMKSLVKGVVVGSGVEWDKRADLLEVVLDDEDEVG